jgi:hypothetical protein
VTATEAQMLDRMSVWDVKALHDIEGTSSGTATSQFPPLQDKRADFAPGSEGDKRFRNWALNDGHNDAFRHAYANALMTQRFGADFTERFTRAHEGVPGNKADREAMDLYNNEVGRRIAVENPNVSEEQLAGLVRQAIDRGELLVIDRAGNLAWSDQVRYGEHGIANDGTAPGPLPRPQPGGAPDGSGPGVS